LERVPDFAGTNLEIILSVLSCKASNAILQYVAESAYKKGGRGQAIKGAFSRKRF
jgi:hypothetical protein